MRFLAPTRRSGSTFCVYELKNPLAMTLYLAQLSAVSSQPMIGFVMAFTAFFWKHNSGSSSWQVVLDLSVLTIIQSIVIV